MSDQTIRVILDRGVKPFGGGRVVEADGDIDVEQVLACLRCPA
jgi:hypothetical protein